MVRTITNWCFLKMAKEDVASSARLKRQVDNILVLQHFCTTAVKLQAVP